MLSSCIPRNIPQVVAPLIERLKASNLRKSLFLSIKSFLKSWTTCLTGPFKQVIPEL